MDIKAIWFNSMQVKCAWEHELCANVCILDYDHQIQHKTYNIYIYIIHYAQADRLMMVMTCKVSWPCW